MRHDVRAKAGAAIRVLAGLKMSAPGAARFLAELRVTNAEFQPPAPAAPSIADAALQLDIDPPPPSGADAPAPAFAAPPPPAPTPEDDEEIVWDDDANDAPASFEAAFDAATEDAEPAEEDAAEEVDEEAEIAKRLRRKTRRPKNFLTRKYMLPKRFRPGGHFWPKSWKRAWERMRAQTETPEEKAGDAAE